MPTNISNILSDIYKYIKLFFDKLACKQRPYQELSGEDETIYFSNVYKSQIHSQNREYV